MRCAVVLALLWPVCVFADDEPGAATPKRKPWTTSRITGSPEPPPAFVTERVRPGLAFDQPVEMVVAPGESRPYVVERKGRILRLPTDTAAGRDNCETVLDGEADVAGLTAVYGLAFHPEYEENRTCFICYILKPELPEGTRVSRFRMTVATDDAPARIDPASETILIEWRSGGHNGGSLKFGPDGYLYITTGDASPPSPPDEHDTGQDLTDLEAAVLRIDVDRTDGDRPYAVPADNPFVDLDGARPEIWAYGFRNPWRMSVDRGTGDLWLGDVGWQLWEMVYRVERGGNYGWSVKEGPQSVRPEATHGPTPILPPTKAHPRSEAASVTGGFVYRGERLPDLRGAYVYGDYVTGKIWALDLEDDGETKVRELTDTRYAIICFFEDHDGEIAFLDYNEGTIHRLVPNPAAGRASDFPTKLSETGIFANVLSETPHQGVAAYAVNATRWMDGASTRRWVAIPGDGTMLLREPTERVPKDWGTTPPDTVLVKTISFGTEPDRRRLETQILHFTTDDWRGNGGEWRGYSYIWNEEQTDATLAPPEGADLEIDFQGHRRTWHVSSRTECYACHNPWAGYRLGFTIPQLDRHANTGHGNVDQLDWLTEHGYVEVEPPKGKNAKPIEPLVTPFFGDASLEQKARSYLHANCAHCHRFGGGGTAQILLDYKVPLDETNMIAVRPTQGAFGLGKAEIIAPGDPFGSVLLYRMARLGRGRMPHVGSSEVDPKGYMLLRSWIASLERNEEEHGPRAIEQIARVLADVQDFQSAFDFKTRQEVTDRMLSSTRGAFALANAQYTGDGMPWQTENPLRVEIMTRAMTRSSEVRGLFEAFVPPADRAQRLGTTVDPTTIAGLVGRIDEGRRLFEFSEDLACRKCHRIGEVGGRIGPDLTTIAKQRNRAQLLESILEPSKTIEPKWLTHVLETTRGRVHTGLLVERTDERVVLRTAGPEEAVDITVPADEVEQLVPTDRSLMPDLLFRDLTAQQLADLLAFLESTK